MKAIFFDLDGTLVDSSQGILNAFKFSFDQLNHDCPSIEELSNYIGPPLETTFSNFFSDKLKVEKAISYFREYYKDQGVYQVQLYQDIESVLHTLNQNSLQLFVTTSKYEPMAKQMLKNLKVDHYFKGIYGSTADRFLKAEVIKTCIEENNLDTMYCTIIGDTKYDMIGGKLTSINTLGVTWGFGSKNDLIDCKPNFIAHKPFDLLDILIKKSIS